MSAPADVEQRLAALRRAVIGYRWEKLARDLVVCYRKRDRRDGTSATAGIVIHRDGCRHVPRPAPRNDYGRRDGTYWNVLPADGTSLATVVADQSATVCRTCQPDLDVLADRHDGAGYLGEPSGATS